jgi:hypothetical protein
MTLRRHFALAILSSLFLAGAAAAQQGQAPQGGPGGAPNGGPDGRPPRPPIDTALDTNGDEVIDAVEIANAPASLKKLDRNRDGKLTPDEYLPQRPGRGAGPGAGAEPGGSKGPDGALGASGVQKPRRVPPIAAAIDVNSDGILDAGEIANAPASLKKLDRNGDGKLTPDEYRPPRPGGAGGGPA